MLEWEAKWSRGESQSPRSWAREVRSLSFQNNSSGKKFVQISQRQAEALQQHHQEAMVQLAMNLSHVRESAIGEIRVNASPTMHSKMRLAYHDAVNYVPQSKPAVTRLDSLDSQYVGPIGVGTELTPKGCMPSAGQSLVYMQRGTDIANATQAQKCHVKDQEQIWVVFDTGSTNIWVSSDLCKSGPCVKKGRSRYNHMTSNTYADPSHGVYLNIEFGTGRISGPQGIDDFHVGPFTVFKQTFGMIQVQDGKVFDEVPFEGILGLAFPKMSANGVRAFFDNIIEQKALEKNEFAFYFSLDNPSSNAILWGGVDKKFYQGDIEYFKVTDPYYWSTDLLSFQIGGQELMGSKTHSLLEGAPTGWGAKKPKAIVDTGTTFFTAESHLYSEVMDRLRSVPCRDVRKETHPDILYRLRRVDGKARDFVLSHNQYMTANSPNDENSICQPAFMKIDIPSEHGPAMVLGEVFLRHYFAVFDRGTNDIPEDTSTARIGFAKAKHGHKVSRHLQALTAHQPLFRGSRQGLDEWEE